MFLLVPCAAMAISSGVSQVGKRGGCVLGLCKRRTLLGVYPCQCQICWHVCEMCAPGMFSSVYVHPINEL